MLEILAIIASPVIALVVGQMMTDRKERIRRRHQVFQSLWLTRVDRGSFGRLSGEHVRALNLIEIEFARTSFDEFMAPDYEAVITTWRIYLHALLNTPEVVWRDKGCPEALAWYDYRDGLFVDVLFEMSSVLGYKFTREDIRLASYAPQGFLDAEGEGMAIRSGIRELLQGNRAIHITAAPPIPPPTETPVVSELAPATPAALPDATSDKK